MDALFYLIIGMTLHLAIDGGLGIHVAHEKGRPATEGFMFGVLLGPLGVIVVALLPTLSMPEPPLPPLPRLRQRLVGDNLDDDAVRQELERMVGRKSS